MFGDTFIRNQENEFYRCDIYPALGISRGILDFSLRQRLMYFLNKRIK